MEDLLPYYERELAFLRQHSRQFAERYPKLAAQLLLSGEGCDDPHVERMIQSFAMLTARVSKKLEDSYPQFTEALLNVLYPHYLRPFPSCSIAHFDHGAGELSSMPVILRGTELQSRPIKGAVCKFRTAWDLELPPVALADVEFDPMASAPSEVRLPVGANALLSMSINLRGATVEAGIGKLKRLRVYIDAEPSVAAALRDALFLRTLKIYVAGADGRWRIADKQVIGEVGYGDDEALIDMPSTAHGAYRYLTEYFCFPEKFNFFNINIAALPSSLHSEGRVILHLALGDLRADSDMSRLLQTLTSQNLRLGCVPVVNLFAQRGDPIRITNRDVSYPVVADARRAYAYDVYAIDSVRRVRQTPQGESITEFRPFFSLRHGETPERNGYYWYAQRDPMLAETSPGYETSLSIVDADFDPVQPKTDVLSLKLTCTNRDLPTLMSVGLASGDLFLEGGSSVRSIKLLRKPSQPCRFDHRRDGQWRIISHLSLNHLSLSGSGLGAFQEMLALYDLPRSASNRRQIEGLREMTQVDKTVWMSGKPFACFVRGVEVRLTLDETSFAGSGLDSFVRCIDRFLGLYVSLNSFIQLVVLSHRTGEELIRCAPRNGDSILL
ncbi:MAG: type VI secretion system baseplate subunit TssF [Gammaproteobacteria bacterium]|nr:type VI secretion system baseplate subunit TssF [Gammaproteobacteria bacterium]MBU1602070.1 type VI secretion system baseplate subunit TssF [Gammaproteobacteria bacterium]MBU2434046.1 type VI secretion system baseplate subunit TssF [Gammaproteobacteria bacterium]MBU2447870.1 type VI secretion system baseplate subunit TssF [Gammaproteobacteria bacterium]